MKRNTLVSTVVFLGLALVVACGGDGNEGNSDAGLDKLDATVQISFRSECEAECGIEAEAANCPVPSSCVDSCVAATSNLDLLCGKCVASGTTTTGQKGNICFVQLGSVEDCSEICLGGTHLTSPSFRPECEAECEIEAEAANCPVPSSCVDSCVAATAGLSTLCGKCVARGTSTIGQKGNTCLVELGSVADCSATCVN